MLTLSEYLEVMGSKDMRKFSEKSSSEKRQILLKLLSQEDFTFDPFALSSISNISADTFYSLIVFADAAKADPNSVCFCHVKKNNRVKVGKFIISMCSGVNDILVVLLLLRLVGMLTVSGVRISFPILATITQPLPHQQRGRKAWINFL